SLQATNGLATLSVQGMTASADNEILSQWLAPGTFELAVERISLDASSGDIQAADLPAFDIAGLELRTLVRLDAERNSVDGSASIALGSARFGADTRISSARLDVAARRLDAA